MSPGPLDRAAISALIPHQGTMCLLDAVVRWDAQMIHCRASNHRDPRHPLAQAGRLAALHLIEYGAQAMAVHGGLLAQAAGTRAPPGMLASVREVSLAVERIDDLAGDLELHARRLLASGGGWLYEFSASIDNRLLAQGRIAVINAD